MAAPPSTPDAAWEAVRKDATIESLTKQLADSRTVSARLPPTLDENARLQSRLAATAERLRLSHSDLTRQRASPIARSPAAASPFTSSPFTSSPFASPLRATADASPTRLTSELHRNQEVLAARRRDLAALQATIGTPPGAPGGQQALRGDNPNVTALAAELRRSGEEAAGLEGRLLDVTTQAQSGLNEALRINTSLRAQIGKLQFEGDSARAEVDRLRALLAAAKAQAATAQETYAKDVRRLQEQLAKAGATAAQARATHYEKRGRTPEKHARSSHTAAGRVSRSRSGSCSRSRRAPPALGGTQKLRDWQDRALVHMRVLEQQLQAASAKQREYERTARRASAALHAERSRRLTHDAVQEADVLNESATHIQRAAAAAAAARAAASAPIHDLSHGGFPSRPPTSAHPHFGYPSSAIPSTTAPTPAPPPPSYAYAVPPPFVLVGTAQGRSAPPPVATVTPLTPGWSPFRQ